MLRTLTIKYKKWYKVYKYINVHQVIPNSRKNIKGYTMALFGTKPNEPGVSILRNAMDKYEKNQRVSSL